MKFHSLAIKGFKNLNLSEELTDRINLILSPNGVGKTNLLESLYMIANGVSFRSYPEVNLIGHSATAFAKISVSLDKDKRSVVISRYNDGSIKKLFLNGQIKSLLKFSSSIHIILFSPNTVDLVAGSPDLRRKDMDTFLSILDHNYKIDLFKYRKVIKHRNYLLQKLKSGNGSLEELDYWNDQLIDLGSRIIKARLNLIGTIRGDIHKISKRIFRDEFSNLSVIYTSNIEHDALESSFRERIINNLDKEISIGLTLFGPHRDDISFLIDDKSLRIVGSRGQQRISALIYKLALIELLNNLDKPPIILFDDIMSELDKSHRTNIEAYISEIDNQVFITSCEKNEFSGRFIKNCNLITLKQQ